MASRDGTALDRETRFARAFHELHKLAPPVAIEDVLSDFADVEYDQLPCPGEAVVVSTPGSRPRVVVSSGLRAKPNRLRFTLAHELGHIVLPWQIGAAICFPYRTLVADDATHADGEAQANRFARELLVPRAWLATQLGDRGGSDLGRRIVEIAAAAGVSPITAAIAMEPAYSFPAATHIIDTNTGREYRSTSVAAAFLVGREMLWWERSAEIASIGGVVTVADFGPYRLSAIHFDPDDAPNVEPQAADAKSILLEVLWGLSSDERKQAQAVFSGIIGHANNSPVARASPAAMLQALRQRFAQSEKFRDVRAHPRFDAYLHAKAAELFSETRVPKRRKGGANSPEE
ncbi:MAG TPA: ImmA/IrrE family metallo-endopeptidase [Polyangiaceae bacterium]|nr:ImmA/IrrE family metallo-endopeptidase [Polyangiaceae bacterium]